MKQDETTTDSVADSLRGFFRQQDPTLQEYTRLYRSSIDNCEDYWKSESSRLTWNHPFTEVHEQNFEDASIRWFSDGALNGYTNAVQRHIDNGKGDSKALTFFSNDGEVRVYTYNDLAAESARIARALTASGLTAGDRAALYLPDCPETILFMLACAALGVIYVPIPYRFTAEIATEIVHDSGAKLLLAAVSSRSESYPERSRKVVNAIADVAIVLIGGTDSQSYDSFLASGDNEPAVEANGHDAEHPLFLIYANSATGIPRGSVFATGGYLVQAATSFTQLFRAEHAANGVACTVNLASAGGQSYGIWGPLLNGAHTIITDAGEKPSGDVLKTILGAVESPAAIVTPRLLSTLRKSYSDDPIHEGGLFSMVVCLGDVLTPRFVAFAGKALTTGDERVINLWIQSESGTAIIATYPAAELNRSGALGLPSPGVVPMALNTLGNECRVNESGQLVFRTSWPGMIRGIWEQPDRFQELYFRRVQGCFATNDAVRIDNDGVYWFMGRLDDVVKVRGQSLATSEIETVLVTHSKVDEAAVVSIPGDENDNLIAFISLEKDTTDSNISEKIKAELTELISSRIGEFALPGRFVFARELPKTRTGKLVRRVLRRIASGSMAHDEDLSHVANPEAVKELVDNQN